MPPTATRLDTTTVPYAALVLAALAWGVSTATTKYALGAFAPTDLLVVELGTATVCLWLIPRVRRCARTGFRRGFLLLGLLEPGVSYAFFNFGLERTSGADAAVLVSLEGVAVALLGAVFLRERLTRALTLAVALGFGGAVLLASQEGRHGASLAGDALVVVGVGVAAAYSIVARRVAPGGNAVVVTAYQLVAGFVVAVLLWAVVSGDSGSTFGDPSANQWLAGVATGLLGSAVPFLLFTFAISRLPVAHTGVASNLVPVFGVGAAVLLLGERLTAAQLAGTGLVVVGLATAQLAQRNE